MLAVLLGGGCSSSGPAAPDAGAPRLALDSLRAENLRLRETNAVLRDSLRLLDDVESGRYYRSLRTLRDRIGRMRYDLTLLREGGTTVEVLPADALFEPASARLSAAGRTRLDSLAARLGRAYPERSLRVEGHADDAPLSEELQQTYASNWELSALRAAAVVRYLIDTHRLAPGRFELAAFSDTRPVASNETAAGRRQNRRVRVAALPEERAYSRPGEEW